MTTTTNKKLQDNIRQALSYFLKAPVESLEYVHIVSVKDDIATVSYVDVKGKNRLAELDLSAQHMKMFLGDSNE
jgi:hypothetical protein